MWAGVWRFYLWLTITFDRINLLLAGTLDEIEDRKPGQAVRRLIHRSSDRREDI